jgi:hypothetical protein
MSPPDADVCEPGVAVVERDPAIESLLELNFGAGKAVAAALRTAVFESVGKAGIQE